MAGPIYPVPTESNLTRFQPRLAAVAAGTPLSRYQQQLARTAMASIRRRRLPIVVAPPPPPLTITITTSPKI
jgi:hypothetical protein